MCEGNSGAWRQSRFAPAMAHENLSNAAVKGGNLIRKSSSNIQINCIIISYTSKRLNVIFFILTFQG